MKVASILGLGEGLEHEHLLCYCDDVAQIHRTCQVGLAASLSSQGSAAGYRDCWVKLPRQASRMTKLWAQLREPTSPDKAE